MTEGLPPITASGVASPRPSLTPTRYSVQDFSQSGGDGEVQGAILVSCSVHRVLDQVAGSIDTTFVQLGKTNDLMPASQKEHNPLIK